MTPQTAIQKGSLANSCSLIKDILDSKNPNRQKSSAHQGLHSWERDLEALKEYYSASPEAQPAIKASLRSSTLKLLCDLQHIGHGLMYYFFSLKSEADRKCAPARKEKKAELAAKQASVLDTVFDSQEYSESDEDSILGIIGDMELDCKVKSREEEKMEVEYEVWKSNYISAIRMLLEFLDEKVIADVLTNLDGHPCYDKMEPSLRSKRPLFQTAVELMKNPRGDWFKKAVELGKWSLGKTDEANDLEADLKAINRSTRNVDQDVLFNFQNTGLELRHFGKGPRAEAALQAATEAAQSAKKDGQDKEMSE